MAKTKSKGEIDELLSRGVSSFIDPGNAFRDKLVAKATGSYTKDIVIKLGCDPNRPDIHLGHAVILRKLRTFQDLGCKVVFLIGDYTAQIGDPTGKSKTRPEVEQKEVEANMKTYVDQVGKILRTDPEVFSWIRNSDWFTAITDLNLPDDYKITLAVDAGGKKIEASIAPNSFVGKAVVFEKTRMQVTDLGLKDRISVITLRSFLWGLRHITHSRLIERDMFEERIRNKQELFMHEMMYPVLQGIDSQVIAQIYGSCDLEVGGTDQTFNMLMGRDIMAVNKQEPQSVLAFELLVGTDGKEKMSKSLGNYIGITDAPNDMYGKIMSIPDSAIAAYFELCTYEPVEEVERIKKEVSSGKTNPRTLKAQLARQIVAIYHGEKSAIAAEENFVSTFAKGGMPSDVKEVEIAEGALLVDVLLENGLVASKSEFRRLIEEGAISAGGEKINDPAFRAEKDADIKVGKHRFLKIKVG